MTAPTVRALRPEDRAAWAPLAAGYKAFYNTPTSQAEYDEAFNRLVAGDAVCGLGAWVNGELVGIAHYFFHATPWARAGVCYLQDLFTAPVARGHGVGRALIEAIAAQARACGCVRYYWLTQDHNATARTLYDKVALNKGFIRYDYPL